MAKKKTGSEPLDTEDYDAPILSGPENRDEDDDEEAVADSSDDEDKRPPSSSSSSLDKIPGVKVASNDSVGAQMLGVSDQLPKDSSSPPSQSGGGSKIGDYQKYLVTPEDLQNVVAAKKRAGIMQGVAEGFGNQQSAGNFWLKSLNHHNDMSGIGKIGVEQAEAPIQAKQVLLSQTMKQPQMDMMAQLQDKNSMPSQLLKANAMAAISQIKAKNPEQQEAYANLTKQIPNLNGYQLKNILDSDPLLKESFTASIQGQKLDAMMARLDQTNETKAQGTFNNDKILNTYQPRLDGASKILGLISAGERGEFATNKSLLGQLNAEIGRLETGSQSPGLGASEKTEMNSVAATLSDLRDSITGNVTGVDLKPKFTQARGMVGDLAKSYYGQMDDRMDQLRSGALPSQSPVLEAKQNTFRNIYQKRFASSGLKLGSGSPGGDQPSGGDQGGGLINSANAGQSQTMMKDGHTYVKVPGGWKIQGGP